MAAFEYNISLTGDCTSTGSGAISLLPFGGTPPYTVEWINPNLGNDIVTIVPSVRNNLFSTTYSVRLNDSTLPTNQEFYINIPLSNGVCAYILNVNNTTCELNNGSVTGTSSSNYSSTNYYLYKTDDTYITSAITNTSQVVFGALTANTYYLVAQDLGGCTGRSEDFVIQYSTPLDFGLYVVPNSSCGGTPIGKIYVTGQTGTSPYKYLWDGGQTGGTITGLTAGPYSVQVTDGSGCVKSKTGVVNNVDPIGFGVFTVVSPTCLQSNGSVTLTITGGTAPYYYSASTGYFLISYSKEFTISNLSSGQYNFQVTDSAFCTILVGTTLNTPSGISGVNVTSNSSSCSSNDGSITISVNGGTTPYTYTIIYPDASTENISNSQTNYVFQGLSTGTYTVGVSDSSGCSFLEEVTIVTENSFTISTYITGTTCNQNNGTIYITKNVGGTSPYDYSLDGIVKYLDTTLTGVTISNVASGQHTVSVTDALGCVQTQQIYVSSSTQLNFSLYSVSCGSGNEGEITSFISSGTPPFVFTWSDNVYGNPQQIQVGGLTAGTYSLTIVDSTGCSLKRSTTITCDSSYVSYQCYVMGSEVIQIQSPTKLGLLQMLNEGFADLTAGNTNCVLNSAIFTAKVSVLPLGTIITQDFFTSTSLISVPADNVWYNTIDSLVSSILGVQDVIIDQINNQIIITRSTTNDSLNGQEIIIELVIVYDIMCLS